MTDRHRDSRVSLTAPAGTTRIMAARTLRVPHPLLVAILGIVVGLGLAVFAVTDMTDDRALDTRGQETTARVVEVTERRWPKAPRLQVEFTADGRTARAWIAGDRGDTPRTGQEVRVRYDPRDPEGNTAAADRTGANWLLFAVAALFLIGAPALAWFVIRPVRRRLAEDPRLAERVARANGS